MLDTIKKLFAGKPVQEAGKDDKTLDAGIALCVLLLEAAHVDGECSDEEMDHIAATLENRYGVPREEIEELIAGAHKERQEAIDIFRFTRYMNASFTKEEKLAVMESVWRIIHTDGRLQSHEDHLAHKLANLLRLTHKELIDCKIKARQPS